MTFAPAFAFAGLDIPPEVVVLGTITGLTYALLGVGLTLVYRSSRVVNFAHGEMGALPAVIVPLLVLDHHVPYGVALLAALGAGLVVAFTVETVVVRRLVSGSPLILMVATIGIGQLLLAAQLFLPQTSNIGAKSYPVPFQATFRLGDLRLGTGQLLILGVVPVLVAGLSFLLSRTRLGLATRACADNLDAARLSGMPAARVSRLVWFLAGLLATASAILAGPTQPLGLDVALGPSLLLRALAAALIGGLSNLALVFAGGVAIGVVEFVVLWNHPTGGIVELVLFVVVVAALTLRRVGPLGRGGEQRTSSLTGSLPELPVHLARSQRWRVVRRLGVVVALGLAVLAPVPLDSARTVLLASVTLFALMGLSVVVLTGFAGQLSLGQFAFVGIGALVGGRMAQLGYPLWMQALYAAAAGAVAAVVVGLPAVRLRGLFLGVTTLGFAVVAAGWLPRQRWLVHDDAGSTSLQIPRPHLFGVDFTGDVHYYWLCLAVLVAGCAVVHRVRRTGIGRNLGAVRDNEPFAASLSVSPARAKLVAFVVSGVIASTAGYFYGGLLVSFGAVDSTLLSPAHSLTLVAMVVFGGVTTITGALVGAVWVRGIPYFLGDEAGILASGAGLLAVLLVLRGGLASVLFRARDALARRVVGDPQDLVDRTVDDARPAPSTASPGGRPLALEARALTVRYGGLAAVNHVDLVALPGEIVGIIGPNGAGKTTLFDALSGHARAAEGTVHLGEHDVTGLPAEARARLGLGRTFQQARLFQELTLIDTVQVALERHRPSATVPSLLGLPPSRHGEREKLAHAAEVLDRFGLTALATRRCGDLPTGTRRLAELACATALGSQIMLLDEPTAGLAPDEIPPFMDHVRALRSDSGATVVIIAHDVPMLLELAERVYVMAAGRVIAEGPPALVRDDPRVLAAYFGIEPDHVAPVGATT